jgi:hypothetical protein
MTEVIEKIAILLGVNRDNSFFDKRKKKPGAARKENDTVTISTEARRLVACSGKEGTAVDDAMK